MSKSYDNAKELEYINYDSTNNKINFSVAISTNGSAVAASVYDANSTSNGAFSLPTGNTASRPASPQLGSLRYNTTNSWPEVYTNNGWQAFAAQPYISSVTPTVIAGNSNEVIDIYGSNFGIEAQVYFIDNFSNAYLANTVTYYSNTHISAPTPRDFTVGVEPLDVKVVQNSGVYTLENAIDCGTVPTWVTTAGSLGSIFGANTVNVYVTATDSEGSAVTYSLVSGSLPGGLNLSSNGLVQGVATGVTATTTYNFTIKVSDIVTNNVDRTFSYQILNRDPIWNTSSTLTSYSTETFTPITVNAYDPDGGVITYSLTSGSVPSGLSFVSANATITGTPNEVTNNTTSSFTVTATDVGSAANTQTFSLTITPIIDPQFANTVLLLKAAGNTVVQDVSSNNQSLTVVADARASNFSPYNTSWSNYFGTYATDSNLTYVPGTSVAFGTGDFTVECWAYWDSDPGSIANPYIIDTRGGGGAWAFSWNWAGTSSGSVLAWTKADGTNHQSTTQMPLYKWNHCAYVRSGTTGTIYLNGVSILSFTDSTNYSASISLAYLGKRYSGNQANPGYLSNLRIVKGTAVYTSAFTPPTSKLTAITNTVLLTCQSNGFKDSSTANSGTGFTITTSGLPKAVGFSPFEETDTANGSMYFDGSGDYVSLGKPYNFGSNNFTVEGWFYLTTLSGSYGLWGSSNGGGGQPKLQPYISSGNITLDLNGGSAVAATAATYLQSNAWNHIAFCRGGTSTNQTAMFINGVRAAVGTVGSQTGITTNFTIGYNESGVIAASYISNFRVVDGTDVYGYTNTTYTVPTAPLTAITNTVLLTLQNRQPHNNHGFQDSSRGKNLITRSGNATQGTFTPFSADPGKWSNYFDGTDDRLTTPSNAAFTLGTGDYTYECWVYHTDISGQQTYFARGSTGNYNGVYFYKASTTNLIGVYYTGQIVTSSTAIEANRWYHLVACRASGTLRLFINGVQVGSSTDTTNLTESIVQVGADADGSNGVKGYMSNARVIKGVALYTTNFTPSTAPLTAVTGTSLLTAQDNRFKDNSTNAFTITPSGTPFIQPFSPFAPNSAYSTANTGGSIYLDGTGDYLTIGSGTDVNLGTSDFSMEYWYYLTAFGSYAPGVFCKRTGGVATGWTMLTSGFVCLVGGTWYDSWATPYWVGSVSTTGFNNSTSTTKIGQWTHVLLTRQGTDARWFVNGQLIGYQSRSGAIDQLTGVPLAVGFGGATSEQPFTGYISGARISLGSVPVDYQTSSTTTGTQIFVPSTSPPTITSQNTRSNSVTTLLNFTDAAIIDYSGKNVIETVGDAKANNSTYKFTPGSMHFDGTTDYLKIRGDNIQAFRYGEYTVEFWGYPLSLSSGNSHVVGFNATNGFLILATNSKIVIHKYGVGDVVGYNTPPAISTWVHYAFVREGTGTNQTKIYLNGNLVATGTDTNDWSVTTNFGVGINLADGSSQPFSGNIQDLRITRAARYLANFTPPTRSFPIR